MESRKEVEFLEDYVLAVDRLKVVGDLYDDDTLDVSFLLAVKETTQAIEKYSLELTFGSELGNHSFPSS